MKILYADEFRKQFSRLPEEIRSVFKRQEVLFKANWRDVRLHVKKLTGGPFPYSFRVTRRYRVLFIFISNDREAVLFATIGHRRNVYV